MSALRALRPHCDHTTMIRTCSATPLAAAPLVSGGTGLVGRTRDLFTTYEPVSPMVAAGDRVTRGQRIGTVAPDHPGCPVAVCLHWGVLRGPARDGNYLNPLQLLATARVRLLPVDGLPNGHRRCLGRSAGGSFQHLAPQP
jgi:hypothetical protein